MKRKRVMEFLGIIIILTGGGLLLGTTAVAFNIAGDSETNLYLPLVLKPEAPPPSDPDWLQYVNSFRVASGLETLSEEAAWSQGAWLHSRYMVKNDVITHSEEPSNLWYTPEGAAAADHSNIYVSSSATATFETAVNWWLRAPFHALTILDPELQRTGFGIYNETIVSRSGFDWQMGATIDVERGRDGQATGTTLPIFYPGDGGTTPFTHFGGNEYPNPLSSCAGYTEPVGAPLFIQIGEGSSLINVTASRLQRDNVDVLHCIFDETNYSNSDSNAQNSGRIILDNRDAVVIMPRNPLQAGSVYQAEITNDGVTYSWQFTVVGGRNEEGGAGAAP